MFIDVSRVACPRVRTFNVDVLGRCRRATLSFQVATAVDSLLVMLDPFAGDNQRTSCQKRGLQLEVTHLVADLGCLLSNSESFPHGVRVGFRDSAQNELKRTYLFPVTIRIQHPRCKWRTTHIHSLHPPDAPAGVLRLSTFRLVSARSHDGGR